jgi:hypothetical protein
MGATSSMTSHGTPFFHNLTTLFEDRAKVPKHHTIDIWKNEHALFVRILLQLKYRVLYEAQILERKDVLWPGKWPGGAFVLEFPKQSDFYVDSLTRCFQPFVKGKDLIMTNMIAMRVLLKIRICCPKKVETASADLRAEADAIHRTVTIRLGMHIVDQHP